MDDSKIYTKKHQTTAKSSWNSFKNELWHKNEIRKVLHPHHIKGNLTPSYYIIPSSKGTLKALTSGISRSTLVPPIKWSKQKRDEKETPRRALQSQKKILKTSVNSKNTIQAISILAVLSILCRFQLLEWLITEVKMMWLYVSRTNARRDLYIITDLYKSQIMI